MDASHGPAAAESSLQSRLEAIRLTDRFEPEVVDQFASFITRAPDEELMRMSPLRYAEQKGISEQLAIDLFLYATHAGILDFIWGALCPSCGALLTKKSGPCWP